MGELQLLTGSEKAQALQHVLSVGTRAHLLPGSSWQMRRLFLTDLKQPR